MATLRITAYRVLQLDTEIELDEDEDLENFLIQFLADQKNSDFDSVTEEYVVTDSGQTIPII